MESDAELVARARRGDQQAFGELVRRHSPLVFRLAVSILGQEFAPEAEDVTQEVLLKVHSSLDTFRGDSEFSSWIYRIAFNMAVNQKARARFQRKHVGEEALDHAAAADPGPYQQAETSERDQVLAECIGTLPEIYQSALRLYYWLDTGIAEMATLLGVPENTAKSYLFRARQLLQSMLKQRGYSYE